MRLTKTVGQYWLGRGSLGRLNQLLEPQLADGGRAVYFVDHYFRGNDLIKKLPARQGDEVIFVDTTDEPTTDQVDALTRQAGARGDVAAIIGIGGGATMDCAKAVSNLLTNGGCAADYQGWDLVPSPGVFKIGVPTVSGTGAEASRTCVMMNQAKNLKLGMNSDHTVFDRLVLDPDLIESVPDNQYFYTGMDSYIHCVESLSGSYRHALADAYSRTALGLCREVFLDGDMKSAESREKMMVASYLGGSAIGNSFVGVVHPLSAGLSMVFHTHHCVANCIVMNAMDEFYPDATREFRTMARKQGVTIPTGVCDGLDEEGFRRLYASSIVHEKPLANALGADFRDILTYEKVKELYRRM
jgi:3-deoxy-alpha-D-manno-octulosonate 8-oxidase